MCVCVYECVWVCVGVCGWVGGCVCVRACRRAGILYIFVIKVVGVLGEMAPIFRAVQCGKAKT